MYVYKYIYIYIYYDIYIYIYTHTCCLEANMPGSRCLLIVRAQGIGAR